MEDAERLLGEARAAAARGDGAAALAGLRGALAAAPAAAAIQREAGLLFARLGRPEEARAALDRAARQEPLDPRVAEGLARLDLGAGRIRAALAGFRRAATLAPAAAGPRIGFGRACLAAGQIPAAIDAFEAAARLAPDDPRAPHQLGLLYLEQGLLDTAVAELGRAAALAPQLAQLPADLGLAQQTAGRLAAAAESYRAALALDERQPQALRGLARLAELRRAPDEGLAVLGPVVERGTTDGGLLSQYGALLALAGRRAEAVALLEERLPGLERAADRMEVSFRLAALHDAAGEPERAFAHAATANRLKGADFDPAAYRALIDRLLANFDRAALARCPRAANRDERPLLVVGMPRSGTSLVEQILASHPAVFGAGELTELGLLALATGDDECAYPESVARLDAPALDRLADAYRARLDALAPGAARVVDKMWQNFEYLGFASLLLPGARVIWCRRDPADLGLSNYLLHFFGEGVPFAYDLDHIGRYTREHERAMKHWQSVLDLPLLEVHYEALVAEPEAQIRRLVDFAGLPWHPGCLRFHETERVVRTASANQVRRPLYASSVGRHQAYARWLGPLYEALEGD